MAEKNIKVPKYVSRLVIFSIIMAGIVVLAQQLLPAQYASPALPYIVLFFFVITLFTLYVVLRDSARRESRKFVSGYMVSRIVKFMSCLLFLLIYFIVNKEDRWNFAFSFCIIYFLYAIFEVLAMKKENDTLQKENNLQKENGGKPQK